MLGLIKEMVQYLKHHEPSAPLGLYNDLMNGLWEEIDSREEEETQPEHLEDDRSSVGRIIRRQQHLQTLRQQALNRPAMAQGSRLRYPFFRGKEGEDPDLFLQEFAMTAEANRENTDNDKLRLFPALLKKRASKWFVGLPPATQQAWRLLRDTFRQEFRDLGYKTKVFNQLNNLQMKDGESLRRYTQRFKDLARRTNTSNVEALIEWYVGGLPRSIARYCRRGPQSTINDVVATSETYETARQTDRIRKKKKKRQDRDDSSSDSSSEEESSDSNSASENEKSRNRHRRKEKKKKHSRRAINSDDDSSSSEEERHTRKKKTNPPKKPEKEEKNPLEQLVKEMTELRVQLAAPKEKRKDAKSLCYDLWCSIYHNQGHTKDDCRLPKANTTTTNTHWIAEAPVTTADDYFAEGADGQVYHVSMTRPSGNGPKFGPPRYNPPEYVGGRPNVPSMTRVTKPVPTTEVVCYRCGEKGHYANSCPNPQQRHDYIPLCQNCREPGHTSPQCMKPMIPRQVQFVDVPSTSGTKNVVDVNVQTVSWEPLPSILEEKPTTGASSTPSTLPTLLGPRSIPVALSESEGWPSKSEWMVNNVITRSKKQEEPLQEESSEPKTKKKTRRRKKAGKKADSSTSDTSVEEEAAPRNVYKDDISDLILKALKGKAPAEAEQESHATGKTELPKPASTPTTKTPMVATTVGELKAEEKVKPMLPISANMEFDLVQSLATMPAPISVLQLLMENPQLLKDLIAWSRQQRTKRRSRGLRIRRPKKVVEVSTLHVMVDKGA
ncbi:hypothetical protein R1sor_009164 [Riccia sorocarpa]|uniref:CCHC-type domain-containing protein n=1 Tax=Riccia sorocarpa TaxID=122646 RepID=A0ABD3H892_9MARC